ncbi:hypothetical protein [Acetobacter malorum]|uniref:hypothetical protein n=1 Tax=Acetobacter malorum TaxID=178901 RepID=UPI00248D9FD0|nr:hypothetical protein [Acetobacter malorum]
MRRMTKLLLALPLIAGTTLATLPAAEAHPGGGWGRPAGVVRLRRRGVVTGAVARAEVAGTVAPVAVPLLAL